MQQGIQSLMPQGSQQGPMPGQAPQMPMPGMMPKQGAPTPPAMVGPLTQMHLDQLMQLMLNPRPEGPPLYAVISAITEKQKQAQAQANMQRQMAMAQGQQAAQQPPIAAQVMQAAEQQAERQSPEQQIRRRIEAALARGSLAEANQLMDMLKQLEHEQFTSKDQGYAGGGAVAFQYGGATLPRLTGESDEDYAIRMSSLPQQPGETDRQYQRRIYSGVTRGKDVIAPELPLTAQQRERQQATELQQASQAAPGYGSGIDAVLAAEKARQQGVTRNLGIGQPRLEAAPAPARAMGAPTTGLPALAPERAAQIQKDQEEAERLAKSKEEYLKGTATQSPEVLASRERLQKILSGAYDPQRQALEEAKAERARGLRGNAEALGFMAARASRGRRAGQVLGEAAGAAAEIMGGQRKRVEELTDKYNTLKSQLDITMAQAQHADIVGDDKLKREAAAKAEEIKAELFNTQRAIRGAEVAERVQNAQGIAALRKADADMISAQAQTRNAATHALAAGEHARLVNLKLQELTGGKPETATTAQRLEAEEYALTTKGGAGRAGTVEAQNTRAAMKALADWDEKTGNKIRMMNPKTPKVYEDAKKEEIARIRQAFGIDLSVPSAGAATTTKSGATVSNWN